MFGIAFMSKPSACTLARQTSTERSFVYVDSSGESRRRYCMCAFVGTASRSGPSRRSNQRSRIGSHAVVVASLAATSTCSSARSEIAFSSSLRTIGSGSPERSASNSSHAVISASRSGLNRADAARSSSPSSSRSAYDSRTARRASAERSGSSSPWKVTRAPRIAFSSASSCSATDVEISPASHVFRSRYRRSCSSPADASSASRRTSICAREKRSA